MGTLPHRIHRQKWEVSAGSEAEAFSLRKQIRERWEETIVPVFEKVFDEHSNGDEILHIPRLEIKLKVSGDQEMWESINALIYNQLSELIGKGKSETGRYGFYNLLPDMPGSQQQETGDLSATESDMIRIPAKRYRFEVLVHYLQNGNLPWQENIRVNEASEELAAAVREHWQQLAGFLSNYQASHALLFRLFQFLAYDEIILLSKDLCRHLSIAAKEELNSLIAALLQSGDSDFNPHTRKILLAAFVEAGISHHQFNTIPDWFEKAGNMVPPEKLDKLRQSCIWIQANPMLIPLGKTNNQDKNKPVDILEDNDPAEEHENLYKNTTSDSAISSGMEELLPKAGKFLDYQGSNGNLSTEDSEKDYFGSFPFGKLQNGVHFMVQNAGLLLLHPFIARLFNHTGIVAVGSSEIPRYNLANAAALLHFLATGREEVYEFELGFIKILLGLEPDQQLTVSGGTLSKHQKEESESLLTSVREHWIVIKSTSVSGLQDSFLQRPAMVCETEEGWRVQPKSRSYDMLIATVPWGFAVIKLPWMNKPIYTEWQTN